MIKFSAILSVFTENYEMMGTLSSAKFVDTRETSLLTNNLFMGCKSSWPPRGAPWVTLRN